MTPEKSRLLAELMAERFPHPDELEVEARSSIRVRAEEMLAALEPDAPEVTAHRRAVLEAMATPLRVTRRAAQRALIEGRDAA